MNTAWSGAASHYLWPAVNSIRDVTLQRCRKQRAISNLFGGRKMDDLISKLALLCRCGNDQRISLHAVPRQLDSTRLSLQARASPRSACPEMPPSSRCVHTLKDRVHLRKLLLISRKEEKSGKKRFDRCRRGRLSRTPSCLFVFSVQSLLRNIKNARLSHQSSYHSVSSAKCHLHCQFQHHPYNLPFLCNYNRATTQSRATHLPTEHASQSKKACPGIRSFFFPTRSRVT